MLADNQHAGLVASSHPQMFQGGGQPSGGVGLSPQSSDQQQGGNPQMDMMRMDQAIQADPEATQKSAEAIRQGLATGLITPQQLHQIIQLAQACMQNPALWPNVRAFAIRNGLAEEADLPQQYNHAMVFAVLLAAKAAEASPNGTGQGEAPQGQPVAGSIQPEAPQAQTTSNGGYVIPADVVAVKGRAFFDKLIQQHHTPEAMKVNRQ